jgi:phosphoribosylanthranilate isomerase
LRVKICGLTNYDDAMYATEFGADALGFVFYKKSPRYISFEDTAKIIEKLPPFVQKIGLFVEHSIDDINKFASLSKIDVAQIHFDVNKSFLEQINFKTLPVIRAKSSSDIELFNSQYRLVDAYCEAYGGSGKRLNLEWFKDIDCSNIIIAGGLAPNNLEQLRGYGFYGVDVSSGVEASKGKKDKTKVKEFIKNAKNI